MCLRFLDGVDADEDEAPKWCVRGATGGDEKAIQMLAIMRRCDFCGTGVSCATAA